MILIKITKCKSFIRTSSLVQFDAKDNAVAKLELTT